MKTPAELIGEIAVSRLVREGYEIIKAKFPEKEIERDFHEFWFLYPAKIGKGAAMPAYAKARKIAGRDEILDGVRRYAAKRDDRPWCHATTWLNQQRWLDEEVQPPAPSKGLAGVRARLEQEIASERIVPEGIDHHVGGGLPLFSIPDHRPHR